MTDLKTRGFTLIELVVVITILGILAAFAIPKFIALDSQARIATVNGLVGTVKSAAALFTVPASALTVAVRAWVSSAMNLGIANAARMPRIVITTTNSISVNPRALRSIICCSAAHFAR